MKAKKKTEDITDEELKVALENVTEKNMKRRQEVMRNLGDCNISGATQKDKDTDTWYLWFLLGILIGLFVGCFILP